MTGASPSILEFPVHRRQRAGAPQFDAFLRQERQGLLRFLRTRTATEQDAEDAVQESMVRLMRYARTEPASAWKPLLFRIASNVAVDQARNAAARHRDAHVAVDDPVHALAQVDELSPDRTFADRKRLELVLQAIAHLPEKCRHIFLLSRFHGMGNQAIADRCGISVRMVEKHVTKALATCRDRVRDYAG